jgi:CRP/FNR family transcriptional regulator, cyclic AMP receptor protein
MKLKKTETITYMPGEYILREGAQCDALFIVKTGQIQIYRMDKHKRRIPMGIVRSGEYLGEMSLITDRPHSANAVALTQTECVKISSDMLEEQLKSAPSWLVALTRGLVFKLSSTNDVLRRNGIVDESIMTAVKAIEDKEKLNKVS